MVYKVDTNHTSIVQILRDMGCSVQSLASVKNGCLDLLIAIPGINGLGHNIIAEVKDGSKSPSHRRLTFLEKNWIKKWKGPKIVLYSVDDAVNLVNQVRALLKEHPPLPIDVDVDLLK